MSLFIAALQQAPPPFWPDNLGEWLAATGTIVALVGGIVGMVYRTGRLRQQHEDDMRWIRAELERRLKDHGERIGDVEAGCNKNGEALQALKISSLDVTSNIREVSTLTGALRSMQDQMAEATEERSKIRERIARLEERTSKGNQ